MRNDPITLSCNSSTCPSHPSFLNAYRAKSPLCLTFSFLNASWNRCILKIISLILLNSKQPPNLIILKLNSKLSKNINTPTVITNTSLYWSLLLVCLLKPGLLLSLNPLSPLLESNLYLIGQLTFFLNKLLKKKKLYFL